jgi:rhamnose utilization protein RhaD (predicted bifunctional aldolase and dehydrogenase)
MAAGVSNSITDSVLTRLTERSRTLGADRTICNWGGGNTSAKTIEADHVGRPTRVLWVKGSGSDLASVTPASFTGLRLDEVLVLRDRPRVADTEMVAHLRRCMTDPDRPRASIETLFHAFVPAPAIDHTHADATNYFACAADGERLARELFGDELIWISYERPGHRLSRRIAAAVDANPNAKLVILQKHGSITWGADDARDAARDCRRYHAVLARRGLDGQAVRAALRRRIGRPRIRQLDRRSAFGGGRRRLPGSPRAHEGPPDVRRLDARPRRR